MSEEKNVQKLNKEEDIIISVKGLSKTFSGKEGEVKALKDIDIDIRRGEIFGVIGMSGAGKSTFVRCLNFLERPTSGDVMIDGKTLGAMSEKELRTERTGIAMIFQHFNLLMQRNVIDNVCFPLEIVGVKRAEAKERAMKLLEEVGLQEKAKSYPAQLSGGQQQRVAIARALANNPKILLCDEATSALDPTTTESILQLLKEINERHGITIVIITHSMPVVQQICHRVAIIDEGSLAEVGDVVDVFSRPKSPAARRMVFPEGADNALEMKGKRCIRIVFNTNSSFEPVIGNMVLHCQTPVNILFAETRDVGGTAQGQMVLQLPEDDTTAARMIAFLQERNLTVEELENYV